MCCGSIRPSASTPHQAGNRSEPPMSAQPKILFVCHNHPDLHPGGTEIFSHGLFQAMKSRHGLEAVYLACVNTVHRLRLPGTLLQSAGRAPDEILLWAGHFDRFTLSQIDLHGIVPEFERLLRAFRPDVVHFHHVLLMGVEALQVVRRVLPEAGIVLTLHDYYPICANDGQMVTTRDRKLCRSASADSCVSCFPGTSRDQFVMRELFIKQNLSLVDRFISPSDFLKRRYIEWGLPEDRIDVVRNGIRDVDPAPHRRLSPSGRRDHFAFFGHLNPFKGALVAIEAAKRLAERTDNAFSLTLHGSADFQTDDFKAELAKACENAPFAIARGRYARDELPALMAEADWVIVPSIWWENAPLIIQEAFQHRRPVICSGIGGMAESVRDGVDGLWFSAGDSRQLADKMAEALDPERWTQLTAGIRTPHKMSEAADEHLALYKEVSAARIGVSNGESMASVPPVATIERAQRELPVAALAPVLEKEATPMPAPVADLPVIAPAMSRALIAAPVLASQEATQDVATVARVQDFEPTTADESTVMPVPLPETPAPDMAVVVPLRDAEPVALDNAIVMPLRDVEPPALEAEAAAPAPDKEIPDASTTTPEVGVMDDGRLIEEVDFRSSYRLRRLLRGGGAA
jgi:glycosyltransferase involved in cell wall biosynthesis